MSQEKKTAGESAASVSKKTGRNMPQAVATGAVLVVIILACILIRIDAFAFLIAVFMVLGLWELRVDFATADLHIPVVELWICSCITLIASFYASDHVAVMSAGVLATSLVVTIASSFPHRLGGRLSRAVTAKQVAAGGPVQGIQSPEGLPGAGGRGNSFANVGVSLLTTVYIVLLACLIVLPTTFGGHPAAHAFMVIFLPALGDIGGLFFGSWFGRHKISPKISPAKSLEGLFGSMLCSLIGSLVIFACTYPMASWGSIWWVAVLMGLMVGITGIFGDLSASMIKRDLGIKDMGHLLKGHGGVLDRVDSILMSAPFVTLLLLATGL